MKFKIFTALALSLLLVVLIGCTATTESKSDVEMRGSSLSQIEGKWEGEYSSSITKRSGPISFDLSSSTTKAIGEITLEVYIPSTRGGQSHRKSRIRLLTKKSQPLEISFVEIENGQVSGSVSPYLDPQSKQTINTTFVGTLTGNQITGTYKSNIIGSSDYVTGIWSVSRTK